MSNMISVIVPIYNVEQYLPKCLESLLAQTYKNLEIILINDGSTDGCFSICERYASKDQRIRIFHQDNKGLSAARNKGLEMATGDLISFVDSDDLIHPDMFEKLKIILDETGAEIAMCKYKEFWGDLNDALYENSSGKCFCYSNVEALTKYFNKEHFLMVVVWNKLYQRFLFEDVSFPVGKNHEDTFTTYKVLYKASKIACLDLVLYFYLKRSDSITGKPYTPKRLEFFEACREILAFIEKEKQQELYHIAARWYLINIIRQYRRFKITGQYPEIMILLKELYRSEYRRLQLYRHAPLLAIIGLTVFYLSPLLYFYGVALKRVLLYNNKL